MIEIAIDPQVRAVVDPDRYAQVAANLLSNARHHGLPGRPVLVTLTRQGDEVCLSVLNETSGLSEAQLANLFEPFKRESADNQRNRNGLGIGLYISQAIAQAHQGRIDVDCRATSSPSACACRCARRRPAPRPDDDTSEPRSITRRKENTSTSQAVSGIMLISATR